ncbi:MAG TPA: cell envelope integrity protein CreD [Rhizomicrobium sp.]|jgi:inner membrane protein|nr:cell envelope integrity protein CreD [Rhizomicrobium sp.]
MATDTLPQPRVARAPWFKFLIVAALTIAMAVPLLFIQFALSDREQTAAGAAQDIAAGWGGTQSVAGPVFVLPYTIPQVDQTSGVELPHRQVAVLLPETLAMKAATGEGTRSRGIFSVPVYRANIVMHATFDKAAMAALLPSGATPLWNEARLAVIVSDAHGLADNVTLVVNGKGISAIPGSGLSNAPGVQAPLALGAASDLTVDTNFTLRGSREFSFSPLGRRTTASIDSTWVSPSFFGAFLPTDRKVDSNGFTASWVVPYLARGFGQSFTANDQLADMLRAPAFGARFYQPVDHYQLVERALKYAILFIALAFLVFFVVETVSPRQLHVVHYALVGAAQALFYLLLLSFCEHIGFAAAYAVAAGATVGLTTLYAMSALADRLRAGVLGAVLVVLYGLLYVILNAEDYALLIGSCLLFAALAATMYVTRKIDWFQLTGSAAAA